MSDGKTKPTIENLLKPNEFAQFVSWMSLPEELREPKSQSDLAKELNVDKATLSDWKNVEGFWDRVDEKIDLWAKGKNADVIQALFRKIKKDPKAPDIQLWLTAFRGFRDTKEVEINDRRETTQKLDNVLDFIMSGDDNSEGQEDT